MNEETISTEENTPVIPVEIEAAAPAAPPKRKAPKKVKPAGLPKAAKPAAKKAAPVKVKAAAPAKKAKVKAAPAAKAAAKARNGHRVPREGTKAARVIAMLSATGGTTIPAIMKRMGWLEHTTRAMLSAGGDLRKHYGIVVNSEKTGNRRVYSIE